MAQDLAPDWDAPLPAFRRALVRLGERELAADFPEALGRPTPPLDCTGTFSFDFAAQAASGVDAALLPGTTVYAQYTYRDPQDPSGFGRGLSGGTAFTLVP